MVLELSVKACIDISEWWPRGEDGKPKSVYAVFSQIEKTEHRITRHTLRTAYKGELEKADIANLVKLARICSLLSGKQITVNDIIKIEE